MIMKVTKNMKIIPDSGLSKNCLKICSWNVQSSKTIGGSKFDDPDFTKIITPHDFICLQEIRQATKLKGFRSHSVLRDSERSGGVSILYRNELRKGVRLLNRYKSTDVIVCKLDKAFFKFKTDRFIINTYITPISSSGKHGIDGRELLHTVANIVNELQHEGHVYLCGDFNSRISDHPGLLRSEDSDDHVPLPEDYQCDNFTARSSQDKESNSYGKDFLSLILNNSLTITNGRSLGDSKGCFTCITPRGSSVVDYFAVSSPILDSIQSLQILPFTIYSDHRPLSLTVSNNVLDITPVGSLEDKYDRAPTRFLYDENSKTQFMEIQAHEKYITRLNTIRDELELNKIKKDQHLTRPDIGAINETYTKYLQDMATECFKQTKNSTKKKDTSKPWFNWDCKTAKRLLNRAANCASSHSESKFLRESYYSNKRDYKKLLRKNEKRYFGNLNSQIEEGQILNWRQFSRLKNNKADKTTFDCLDMENFESFFSNLYADRHKTIDAVTKELMMNMADNINSSTILPDELETLLNKEITITEVLNSISSLKSGKASSNDMISNEILKYLQASNVDVLTRIYNTCFETGVYPWNSNIITPLHKKGSKDNPDNYRAVAVSSVIGKLFSTILLDRLIEFRSKNIPDPPNQLGFTKGAQTYDHILTMQTIMGKYQKLKKPVYAIFVDFKKAFDSVCRPALFLKLAKNGVTGKFYNLLKDMYQNSYGHIKMQGYISRRFNIRKGTEQGHPLSPDLFKLFLNDLSPLLEFANCPELAGIKISHLLWADDLILLSLDKSTAQKQLNVLNEFCKKWGIEPNVSKTKSMIISKNPGDQHSFKLGDESLKNVEEYCYLGITLHKSGKLKLAIDTLNTKATRAFYGLKRTVIKSKLSFTALRTLFDSLIKPILLYGAPLWLPTLPIIKHISAHTNTDNNSSSQSNTNSLIKKIAGTKHEKLHLSFLKWALGVHRKASNIGSWGEAGRYPMVYQAIKLTTRYYERVSKLSSSSLVHAALQEQKKMNLPWYTSIKRILEMDHIYHKDHVYAHHEISKSKTTLMNNTLHTNQNKSTHISGTRKSPLNAPLVPTNANLLQNTPTNSQVLKPMPSEKFRTLFILKQAKNNFLKCWHDQKTTSSKLSPFYDKVKHEFIEEPYLSYVSNSSSKYYTCKLRISAHDLEIEKARYRAINVPREERACKWCSLTSGVTICEDEKHLLFDCDLYHKPRKKLVDSMRKIPLKIELNRSDADGQTLASSYSSFDSNTLQKTFYTLQSPPKRVKSETDQPSPPPDHLNLTSIFSWHHSRDNYIKNKRIPLEESLRKDLRVYIHNALSTFISTCFTTREEFHTELKEKEELFKIKQKQQKANPSHSSILKNIPSDLAPVTTQIIIITKTSFQHPTKIRT